MICQLEPDTGRCSARYIRWYYNIHSQECNYFRYGGCEGNQNNFMNKTVCENSCIATPSIRLFEGGSNSALVQPSIITAPIYEPSKTKKYEAMNSVIESEDDFDRYQIKRHRTNRVRADEGMTRTRRRLGEKEKERKRRERMKERRRVRKLQKKEQKKLRCKKRRERGKKCKQDKRKRKDNKRNKDDDAEVETVASPDDDEEVTHKTKEVVEETKNIISHEIEAAEAEEERKQEKKRDRRRRKRKLKEKRRLEKERNRRNLSSKYSNRRYSELTRKPNSYSAKLFSILDQDKPYTEQKNSLLHTLS